MTHRGVTVRQVRALRGPNLHAFMPVLVAELDIGPYEQQPSTAFPGCTERLLSWLPGLATHQCSLGRPGGFVERLRRGTYLAHICEHVAIELQCHVGFKVAFGRARGTGERGVYRVVVAYEEEAPARAAFDTCQDKALTNRLLRTVGVPVPDGHVAASPDEAWELAHELGTPVVVKPADGNQGKGVSVNLRGEAEVRDAWTIARGYGGDVLVERMVEGDDYRLLVVNGQFVAAARRDPAQVVGDGQHTVGELVALANRDPRRRPGHSGTMTNIVLDEAACLTLRQQGVDHDTIPLPGTIVRLRHNGNLSTSGTATDVTDDVHPANASLAQLAAEIVGLDIAGIDVLCRDIGRPLAEQGGAIVEVNAAPGLRMHLSPAVGQRRDVGRPIVEMLFPALAPSRIPLVAVTGTNGKTTVTRLIAHMFETGHWTVGMTTTEGVYIGGERIIAGDCSGPQSARAVLLHPRVEAAVLETARGGILREGLAFDRSSVGVVTNLSADHLGLGGVNSLEELARVKQVVIETVRRDGAGVLNAEDPLVAEMAAVCDAPVIYFGTDATQPVLAAHLARGGKAVTIAHDAVVLAHGTQRVELLPLARLAWTAGGKICFQVQNALAAAAAAWGSGLNPALIARALATFTSDTATVPGRFNCREINGVELILDYGHNAAAMEALAAAVRELGQRRTVLALALHGHRRTAAAGGATAGRGVLSRAASDSSVIPPTKRGSDGRQAGRRRPGREQADMLAWIASVGSLGRRRVVGL